MAIVSNILNGQLIWSKHLWEIKAQKGCVFLRRPVDVIYKPYTTFLQHIVKKILDQSSVKVLTLS